MMVIRPIRADDYPALYSIAVESGHGFTSLPVNDELLMRKISRSEQSFNKQVSSPGDEGYLFVLEDTQSGEIVGTTGIVSVSTNVVTILSAGSTTIRATQAAAGGYTSAYVDANVTINPIAPTFGSFSIASRDFGAIPFTLTAPTSNSSGAFTYTSSTPSVATVSGNTVTVVGEGTSTITATQSATTNYTSGTIDATLTVTS